MTDPGMIATGLVERALESLKQANVVPVGATAVAINLTIAGMGGYGNLQVTDGSQTTAEGSTINWNPQTTGAVANATIVKLDSQRRLKAHLGGPAAYTHFIVDVTGYYL